MEARQKILTKLQAQFVEPVALPNVIEGDWIQFPDPVDHFRATVEQVGGSCVEVATLGQLPDLLRQLQPWANARRVFSNVAEVPGNVNLDAISQPHELEDLDFVIYHGDFAVVENGAVWLTDRDLRHRAVFFITQFLVLVVRRDSLVNTMHEAYARAEIPSPGFGLFLSGPSKTADIEQSLVIGAHGCRELQIYLV